MTTAVRCLVSVSLGVLAGGHAWAVSGSIAMGVGAAVASLAVWLALAWCGARTSASGWGLAVLGATWGALAVALVLPRYAGERVRVTWEFVEHVSPEWVRAAWGEGLDRFARCETPVAPSELIVRATGARHPDARSSEVWLLEAGEVGNAMVADAGWSRRDTAWVAGADGQPSELRWSGEVRGPLSLTLRQHDHSGIVEVEWNGRVIERDLYAERARRTSVRLEPSGPATATARVPFSAFDESAGLLVGPAAFDRAAGRFPIIVAVSVGTPGESRVWTGEALAEVLRVGEGVARPVAAGVQLEPAVSDRALFVQLAIPTPDVPVAIAWLPRHLLAYGAAVGALASMVLGLWLSAGARRRLVALGLGVSVAAGAAEWCAAVWLPDADRYYVWTPGMRARFTPAPGVMPGIEGPAEFAANAAGLRGRDPEPGDFRILTIGGSTTECLYLDQSETWPAVLEQRLTAVGPTTWVGNAGVSGHTTREHRLHARYLVPQERPDVVVVLAGINDFLLRLMQGDDHDSAAMGSPTAVQALMGRAFRSYPQAEVDGCRFEDLALVRLARRVSVELPDGPEHQPLVVQDAAGAFMDRQRQKRRDAPVVAGLPDLAAALAEYRTNLTVLVERCRAEGARVVLVTQPYLWHDAMAPELERLLLFGEAPAGYHRVADLIAGLRRYNAVMAEVARATGVEFVDLAEMLPRDTTVFVDDVHFNESGARLVANRIAVHLLGRPPYR